MAAGLSPALTMGLPSPHRPGGAGNIAVPFMRKPSAGELDSLAAQGADVFELRLDLAECASPVQARELAASFDGHPLIAAARSKAEGGQGGSEAERMVLLAACVDYACALDVELASSRMLNTARKLTDGTECDLILSYHHFGNTPPLDDLLRLHELALAAGADVFKVSTRTANADDIACLASLLEHGQRSGSRIAVMGVGDTEVAAQSRVELGRAGSCFVFAQAGQSSAPGQPDLAWLAGRLAG